MHSHLEILQLILADVKQKVPTWNSRFFFSKRKLHSTKHTSVHYRIVLLYDDTCTVNSMHRKQKRFRNFHLIAVCVCQKCIRSYCRE
ncbi:hypothetical protein T4B_13071 [Trichinella pseudospiralis]|uniref:Uncharacterized protein n=2 Tax=Trichinella pseudospiralis TaxID=6337 RepID=A0A0V1EJX1_TRIPS|nr:hypothetical protein T4A_4307 [Trichinella pseudospiralis]KRY87793.1 hypothetical protein T4D_12792 [Trichinella pseudospiralis]KRZ28977.1 hypothetical protein T4B_13071 [Trichinella pseudospiralis]KRZ42891.1 hypothetical protein T4C_6855 [Trichinella pseudospiralis]